jgi:hypothetical protein
VSPNTGHGAPVNTLSGDLLLAFSIVEAEVFAVVADGSGGLYIGGYFTEIGVVTRNHIAHIKADNTLDMDWDPNANDWVEVLAVSGSTVYAGGAFISHTKRSPDCGPQQVDKDDHRQDNRDTPTHKTKYAPGEHPVDTLDHGNADAD